MLGLSFTLRERVLGPETPHPSRLFTLCCHLPAHNKWLLLAILATAATSSVLYSPARSCVHTYVDYHSWRMPFTSPISRFATPSYQIRLHQVAARHLSCSSLFKCALKTCTILAYLHQPPLLTRALNQFHTLPLHPPPSSGSPSQGCSPSSWPQQPPSCAATAPTCTYRSPSFRY